MPQKPILKSLKNLIPTVILSAVSFLWILIIPDIIDACINASDGFFVFDLCHIKMYDYWDAFKRGFDRYLRDFEE